MDLGNQLPLGLLKQATMKLDSFLSDVHEIKEDENLSPEQHLVMSQISDMAGNMMAAMINMVAAEIGEEEFLAEDINMDDIEEYPDDTSDMMDTEI